MLVASQPLANGYDGLQNVCHNLIFNSLPWTWAKLEQAVGRIARHGQKKKVTVHKIMASIDGYDYDSEVKEKRLQYKKDLGHCVVDGKIPEKRILPPHMAMKEMREFLAKKRK